MEDRDWDGEPIKRAEWGRDHETLILYCETRAVDYRGKLDAEHLRPRSASYPTRLKGALVKNHGDLDCLADLEVAGIIVNLGTGVNPIVKFTDEGWKLAHRLRRERAERTR